MYMQLQWGLSILNTLDVLSSIQAGGVLYTSISLMLLAQEKEQNLTSPLMEASS